MKNRKINEEHSLVTTEEEITLLPEEGKLLIEYLCELLEIRRVETLKRFIINHKIVHYIIAGKWIIELSSFWEKSLNAKEEEDLD